MAGAGIRRGPRRKGWSPEDETWPGFVLSCLSDLVSIPHYVVFLSREVQLRDRNRAFFANPFRSPCSVLLAGREHFFESTNKNSLKAYLKSVSESIPVEEKRRNSNTPPLSNMGGWGTVPGCQLRLHMSVTLGCQASCAR